ncbi:MAG: DUF2007 domain-containing protein [Verrucomicrobiota bacterium]|nr:DUF2007 domain-containing protein [Verrucomicrobiota bacterium]
MPTVATYNNSEEASLAMARLESCGIDSALQNENLVGMNWLFSNAVGGLQVVVADEDFEAAMEILGEPPPEEGIMHCPFCGSGNVRQKTLGSASVIDALVIGNFGIPPSPIHPEVECADCKQSFTLDQALAAEPKDTEQG